jgi:hypothetical protein
METLLTKEAEKLLKEIARDFDKLRKKVVRIS